VEDTDNWTIVKLK